ncbi:hypothetical protein PORY_001962 [Pneumocystis oryctolagi]|uniref:Uncharacterized protein n=1 Tax=Pneumocystis oryctolagi TaxID=42067 RepID=A0ACB7CA19_9ASCO|nr:hypothetical protein PORY_001962 [Pneumocystis oryctolagi]
MPKILNLRKIQKKKNKESLHPRSRKAKQIQRSIDRDIRLKKAQKNRKKRRELQISRYIYFKSYVELENITKLSLSELNLLIEKYIHRNKAKIDEKSLQNTCRHLSSEQVALKQLLHDEQSEYESGFCVPDLTDPDNVLALKNWTGDYNDLHVLKFIYVQKKDTEKEDMLK